MYLWGVSVVPYRYVRGVTRVSLRCPGGVSWFFGGYLGGVSEVFQVCLRMPWGCFGGVFGVS